MRIDFALLADYAQVVDGKLYVQGGGLTRMTAPSVPWMQPVAVCMRLEPAPDDDLTRDWQFGIAVLGPDDALLAQHKTPLGLRRPEVEATEGEQPGVLVALTLSGLVVQAYGPHRIRLSVEGSEIELPFAVVPIASDRG